MTDSLTLFDMFARGLAVGVIIILGLAFAASGFGRQVRWIGALSALSISTWVITESRVLSEATGFFNPLFLPALAVGGMFWLFVLALFEDTPPTPFHWAPAILLFLTGVVAQQMGQQTDTWLWSARNVLSLGLTLHAGFVVIRGWSDDLLEARRQLRGLVVALAAVYGGFNTAVWLVFRSDPAGDEWLMWTVGRPFGIFLFALILLGMATAFLQARPWGLVTQRRPSSSVDARAEVAERLMLDRLSSLMAAGGWRREGLTIGNLALELNAPEHRLRRLINQRLGHRNFADFVNSYRIEAAKTRLGDPREARTTVAAIAFDLGYGSLGPFNRAFRAATGSTPTEWRRQALQASPDLNEAV